MFEHTQDWQMCDRGWRYVRFGIYKFHRFAEPGATFSKDDYKGFIFDFYYWFPIRFN